MLGVSTGLNLDVHKVLQLSSGVIALPSHQPYASTAEVLTQQFAISHYYCVSALEVVGSNSKSASFFKQNKSWGGGRGVDGKIHSVRPVNFVNVRSILIMSGHFVLSSSTCYREH